jgi:hypothetical protein
MPSLRRTDKVPTILLYPSSWSHAPVACFQITPSAQLNTSASTATHITSTTTTRTTPQPTPYNRRLCTNHTQRSPITPQTKPPQNSIYKLPPVNVKNPQYHDANFR